MSSVRVIARNLFVNWVGHGTNFAVLFFLSPYIVHTLGLTQYGIWQILSVLTGYMGILDLGIRASTGRYIILYLGKEDYEKVDETIRTGMGLYAAVGGLILVASLILTVVFPWAFPSVPSEYHGVVSLLLPVLAVNIWISAFRTILSSVLTAYQRFDYARGSDLIMLFFRTVGTVAALESGFGLVGLAVAVVGCNLIGLFVNYFLVHRVHHGLRLWPLILKKDRVGELFNYGIGAFFIAVSSKIIGQTDLIIVGSLIDVNSVAVYSVGAMLLYYSDTLILGQISTTLFPPLQLAVAKGEMGSARWLVFRQVRLAMFVGILVFVGYFAFSESFIRLWMFHSELFPHESVVNAAQVMAILSCSKLLALYSYSFGPFLSATGHISFLAKLAVIQAFLNVALSVFFVLVLEQGIVGVAAGTLIARLLTSTIIVPPYACHKIGINLWRYVTVIGGSGLVVAVAFSFICYGVQHFLPARSWLEFSLQVLLSTICYIPLALLLLVSVEDRKRLKSKLLEFSPI